MDRGCWGVELYLAIATLKLARPTSVFMLRGNHESYACTSVYGFENELKSKYCKTKRKLAEIPPRQLYSAFKGACPVFSRLVLEPTHQFQCVCVARWSRLPCSTPCGTKEGKHACLR